MTSCSECCDPLPPKPNCAHCYEKGIEKEAEIFFPCYQNGRAFWLCQECWKIGKIKFMDSL